MTNRYSDRAALVLVACLASAPARAGTLEQSTPFRITSAYSAEPALVAPDLDIDDIAGPGEGPAYGTRLTALGETGLSQDAPAASTTYGPPALAPQGDATTSIPESPVPLTASGHVPRAYATHRGFFRQAGSIGPEVALLSAYVGVQSIPKLFKPTTGFHFKDEGWFGKNTLNLGVDKLTHAYNTYLIAELLHYRIHRSTGGSEGDAVTAGILAAGMMALNEISDAIEPDSGYSMQDVTMNVAGAAFSILRNTVPGLKEKLAFKLEVVPNGQIYSRVGKRHYAQQRFMFSLKGAGFKALDHSPLSYLDLQVGYYASDFLNSDRARGITPKRHLFVGVGLNVGELLFAQSNSRVGRAAYSAFDYLQLPYTSLRYDSTGRFGH